MSLKEFYLPLYVKTVIIIIGIIAIVFTLHIAEGIIIPFIFATIIAIVLHPVVNLLIRFKIHRVVAIVLVMFLTFLIIALFGTLLFTQASRFSESMPMIVDRFTEIINQIIFWAAGYFDLSALEITEWITETKNGLIGGAEIGNTIVQVGGMLSFLFLVPVYICLQLYYQSLLL